MGYGKSFHQIKIEIKTKLKRSRGEPPEAPASDCRLHSPHDTSVQGQARPAIR